ncbi:DUF805 domain-containing protein [Roseibium sp.]|uniref:DUF805 domain-containing protein n=1 Tax=Roseibium sp. TaxID=1936156 RepID=UPI003A96E48E
MTNSRKTFGRRGRGPRDNLIPNPDSLVGSQGRENPYGDLRASLYTTAEDTEENTGFSLGSILDFQGRIGRGTFWFACLLCGIIFFLSALALGVDGRLALTLDTRLIYLQIGETRFYIFMVLMVMTTLVQVSLMVRRFHDRDQSGLWVFALAVPILGLWCSITLMFFAGTDGPNRYGR